MKSEAIPDVMKPGVRALITGALMLVAALISLAACAPVPQPSCAGDSLRLMTFNGAVLATMQSNEDVFLMSDEARMRHVAQGVLRAQPDVVVFQEIFHEDAKRALVSELHATYPHFVFKLDAHDLDQDSGLMLFSRYPFAPLPNSVYRGDDVIAQSGPGGGILQRWRDVAFIEFEACRDDDCWANKGIGLVRIQVPCTGRFVNVAFTHLQASYDDDSGVEPLQKAFTRADQLEDIQKIIERTLTDDQLKSEQVIVMGDLNINGNPSTMNAWKWNLATWRSMNQGQQLAHEWNAHFDRSLSPGSFFASYLTDGWPYSTSPQDHGPTAGPGFPLFPSGQGERLDYILYNGGAGPDVPFCLQHISKAWELSDDEGTIHYSDHIGVKADFNRNAPHCNPLLAHTPKPQPDESVQGVITYPGSMQWYRINEPGSYSIDLLAAGTTASSGGFPVNFDVYEAKDLSQPLRSYHGEVTEWGRKFVMPEAPFYVRVFAEQRGWTGGYQIALHRHRGESPQDSITLKPAVRQPYETPYFYPVNPDNVVWFDFRTAVSEHGQFPELKFILEYQSSYNLSFELLHADLTSLDSSTAWGVTGQHLERDDLPKGKYYLKVKLPVTGFMGKTFVMHWQTNLTYWIPMTLKCEVQDDTFGDDTIWYIVDVDRALPTRYRPLGDFDEDTLKGVFTEMGGPRAFLDHVAVWLLEEDHGLNFRHDRWGSQTVTTLPPTEREDWAKMVWKTSSYEYVLQALLLRDPEDLPASP